MLHNDAVKETTARVASSLAVMLDADVMILDDQRNIIAGTAPAEKGYHISYVYNYILEQKKLVILNDPGLNRLCQACKDYGHCSELLELDAPILIDEKCIGIVSVICYSRRQREKILKKIDDCSNFIIQMSALIASRAQEIASKEELRLSASRLTTIINAVDEGIIALDCDYRITFCNRVAEKMLGASGTSLVGYSIENFFPGFPAEKAHLLQNKQEIPLHRKDGTLPRYYVGARDVIISGAAMGVILALEEIQKINHFMGSFISGGHTTQIDSDIISRGAALEEVKNRAKRASTTDSTVLIQGESGTGKELFARAIHNMSNRSSGPFIALNCAAIPDTLLESELFGFESGSFTGAKKSGKPGLFELADTGTIFLDEIGDMPIYLQVKLLRVLQEKTLQRIGGTSYKKIDIRIIAATNKDLEKMVEENRFREDLFYRLNVIPLIIPPLRKRGSEDIEILISYFLETYSRRFGKAIPSLSEEVRLALNAYSWPGNVRELENAVEYIMNMETSNTISMGSLPEYIRRGLKNEQVREAQTLKELLASREHEILAESLALYGKSLSGKKKTAQTLNISIASLYRKLKEYDLE